MSLDDLARQIEEGEVQDVNVIIKADVQGSAEAVKSKYGKNRSCGVRVNVIRCYSRGKLQNLISCLQVLQMQLSMDLM